MVRFGFVLTAGLLFSIAVSHSVIGQEKDKKEEKKEEKKAPTRDISAPGAEHKVLEQLVGEYEGKVNAWIDPAKPPEESTAIMSRKMIFGGRFVQEIFQGEIGKSPFYGMGLIGFDVSKGNFVMTWLDSMNTGITTSFEGIYNSEKKSLSHFYMEVDGSGKKEKARDVITIQGDDVQIFQMFRTREKEKERKILEITYKRRK